MYAKTWFAVKEGEYHSEPVEAMIGVRQGDPLSPALFNIFTNDIPDLFDDMCAPVLLKINRLQCLQYADDIVIMSETKEGLQQCLDKLANYCIKWEMKVNTGKTQVMVFSNKRSVAHQFTLNNCALQNVDNYKYLGCIFSNNRNFKECIELLADKARRATFCIKKIMKNNCLSPKHLLNIFDKMIMPILTYGSEIWGGGLVKKVNKLNLGDCVPGEKIHRHFIKYVLGVHSKASNAAVMAETGRTPVIGEVLKLFVNFSNRLDCAETDSLLQEANEVAKDLETHKIGWWFEYKNVIKECNFQEQVYVKGCKVKQQIHGKCQDYVLHSIENSKKLRTYTIVKNTYNYEPYLDLIKNVEQRKMLTRFRISAHDLNIERGRYTKLQIEDRKCLFCNKVEDEKHFLLVCNHYDTIRKPFLDELFKENVNLTQLNVDNLFLYLLTNEDEICNKILGKMLAVLTNERTKKKNCVQLNC